jgi:hypothetical protein
MSPTKPALEEVTGYLGVGSLQLLGIFFVVDGLTGFYSLVEVYSKSSSFAILFTVPLLVISYVLGLFSSLAAAVFVERGFRSRLSADLFARVVQLGKEALTARYAEVERHSLLLYGCTLAFLLLAVGSLAERNNMPGFESVGTSCFFLGLVIGVACPFLARHLQSELKSYVLAVEHSSVKNDA